MHCFFLSISNNKKKIYIYIYIWPPENFRCCQYELVLRLSNEGGKQQLQKSMMSSKSIFVFCENRLHMKDIGASSNGFCVMCR